MSEDEQVEISEPTVEDRKNDQLCKKYKKIKYEIDMQNFKIHQLKQELEDKIRKKFPIRCVEKLDQEIRFESCKLDKMVKFAMQEQAANTEDCQWGSIPLNDAKITKPPQTPSDISNVSGMAEKLMLENEELEEDRFNLQEDNLIKDQSICDLNNKVTTLYHQISALSKANNQMACRLADAKSENADNQNLKKELEHFTNLAGTLSNNVENMENYLKELRCEYDCLKRDKEMQKEIGKPECSQKCPVNEAQKEKMDYMKEQYEHLLQEFCKKDREHKEISSRLKKCLKNDEKDMERVENEALHKESERLINEIEDYRILIKELQSQIDLYRDKFMKAQERVEKQKLRIDKLESSKNSIESQVNEEIERIKEKFQQKLNELVPYPEKYAESRCELEKSKGRVQNLEVNLKDVSDQLWKAKCELRNLKEQPNDCFAEKYEKMQIELEEQQKQYCGLKKTKECLEEKLCSMKEELDELRRDSAKIITTTRCTADKNRQILHEQINCLEFELAQCRATASLSLTEKEELIKQLNQDLNTLCGHFTGCQGQIKQLKDQIDFLTKQRYKDSDKNLDCYELFSNK